MNKSDIMLILPVCRTFQFSENQISHRYNPFSQKFWFILSAIKRITGIAFVKSMSSIIMDQIDFLRNQTANLSIIDIFKS